MSHSSQHGGGGCLWLSCLLSLQGHEQSWRGGASMEFIWVLKQGLLLLLQRNLSFLSRETRFCDWDICKVTLSFTKYINNWKENLEKIYWFWFLIIFRHMCNPVSLFEAKIEKYCPQDFLDIKVSGIKNGASTKTHLSKN